ncbi:MAG TPA: WG repeat-containing protein [Bacteroidia bacterium]
MKHILYITLLFLSAQLFSQELEIKKEKSKYGIYDPAAKKWKTPATYSYIREISYKNAGVKKVSSYIADTKNGQILIAADGVTKASPEFSGIYDQYVRELDVYIVRSNYEYSLFKMGKGVLTGCGTFDNYSQEEFPENFQLQKGNKYAYYFLKENYCTGFEFDAKPEYFNNAVVGVKNNKYGVTGNTGKNILPYEYDQIEVNIFGCDEYISVNKNNKWGVYHADGRVFLPIQYDQIDFNAYKMQSRYSESCPPFFAVKENGKWGTIDLQNNMLLEPQYDTLYNIYTSKIIASLNGKKGIIDATGKVIMPFHFTFFENPAIYMDYSSGTFPYLVNNGCTNCNVSEGNGKWGLADSTGKIIVEPNATAIIPVRNEIYAGYSAPTELSGNDLKEYNRKADSSLLGYLWNVGGLKSKNLIDIKYDSADYEEIEPTGNYVIMRRILIDSIFSYNITGGKTGLIDPYGKVIIPVEYEDFAFPMFNHGKWGGEGISITMRSLSEKHKVYGNIYSIRRFDNYFAKKNGKWGYYNWPNKEIIAPAYDSLEYESNQMELTYNDSIFKSLGYHPEMIKAYEGENVYYFSDNGKLLYKQLANEKICAFLPLIENGDPVRINKLEEYHVVAVNSKPKAFRTTTPLIVEVIDEWGNTLEKETVQTNTYTSPVGGTLNLLHAGSYKFLFPQPVEDIYLVPYERNNIYGHYYNFMEPMKWSNINQRMRHLMQTKTVRETTIDSLTYNDKTKMNRFNYFPGNLFYKLDNKWYYYHISEKEARNKDNGFDSIRVNKWENFIAYRNGKFGFFSFASPGPYVTETELTYPENYGYRIACKDCKYTLKTVVQQNEFYGIDEMGYELPAELRIDTVKIPVVSSGKFNIYNSNDTLLLSGWYDAILFPTIQGYFSVTDTASYIYDGRRFVSRDVSSVIEGCKQSLAVKEGNIWKLIDINKPGLEIIVDSVTGSGPYWMVIKDGKKFRYDATNISKNPEAVLED